MGHFSPELEATTFLDIRCKYGCYKLNIRARAHALPMRPNQGCGLEERKNLDQAMCLSERSEFAH
jgi:hypothetical protein